MGGIGVNFDGGFLGIVMTEPLPRPACGMLGGSVPAQPLHADGRLLDGRRFVGVGPGGKREVILESHFATSRVWLILPWSWKWRGLAPHCVEP